MTRKGKDYERYPEFRLPFYLLPEPDWEMHRIRCERASGGWYVEADEYGKMRDGGKKCVERPR